MPASSGLRRAIRHAEANDHVGRNVAAFVRPPQGKTGRPSRAVSAAEATALLAAAKDHSRLGAYVILSLTTGILTEVAADPGLAAERRDGLALAPKVAGDKPVATSVVIPR